MIKEFIDFILHIDKYLLILLQQFGVYVYLILFLTIFIETGLVIMPFLPGDSLLFVAGAFSAKGALNVYALFILLSVAAIAGDTLNYWLGSFFGDKVFAKFIKKEHMEKTKRFYDKYGVKTIVLARFVPIVRTFAPFVAGIGKMRYLKFLCYNVIGGIFWVGIFVFSGYYFGNIQFVQENLTTITYAIIIVSLIPPVIEFLKHRKDDTL